MARSKKTIKKKVEIVFDPQKRKEFLSGFRKRKNERKKKAKEELEHNLKEERKKIRLEVKDGMKHMKKSFEPLRELTEKDKTNEDEYEDDDVKVKIVELSTGYLAAQNNMLGVNRDNSEESAEDDNEDNGDRDEAENTNCIPGMDFDVNAKKRKHRNQGSTKGDNDEATPPKKGKADSSEPIDLKSKKELNRLMKTKTLNKIKKSKVFKQKERIDKTANQKKLQRDKNNTLKSLPKHQRLKKKDKDEPSRYRKGRMVNRKQLRQQKRS